MTEPLVSTSSSQYAAKAAKKILLQGGSAADAVAAASMVQIVESGGTYVSFAGIMVALFYDAKTGRVICFDADYGIPAAKEGNNLFERYQQGSKGAGYLIPGYFPGIRGLLNRYGKAALAEIVTPAIERCEETFPATARLQKRLRRREKMNPPAKEVFTLVDGRVVQPDLLKTLQQIREIGLDYMITGDWAENLVKTLQAEGGVLTLADMASYEPQIQEALSIAYKGHKLFGPPPKNAGGIVTFFILKMIEELNLRESGHYTTHPDAYLKLISGLRAYMPFLQRLIGNIDEQALAQMLGGKEIHLDDLLNPETIGTIWEMIQEGSLETAPVDKPENTDAVAAVDQEGNMAILVHSACANTGIDGISVDGVTLSRMAVEYARGLENETERNRGIFSPIMVVDPGKITSAAAIHASLFEKQASVLINMLEYGMSLDEANQLPTPLYPNYDRSGKYAEVLNFEAYDLEFILALKEKGLCLVDIHEAGLTKFVGEENLHLIESPLIGIELDTKTDQVSATTSKHYDGTII